MSRVFSEENDTVTSHNVHMNGTEVSSNITDELSITPTNTTSYPTSPELQALSSPEIIALVIIGILGIAGMIMNTGVLGIAYKARLVKKEYRMIYYIFITFGDLLFATHTVINALSILFKNFSLFKVFAVCWNIQMTLGIVAYQWSAMCIILLIVDLVWSIKYPFSEDGKKKTFSKISCVITFLIGITSTVIPFLYWNDAPATLPFCSIGNVYGVHWNEYQLEAVAVLSVLFTVMLSASALLLFEIYRTHRVQVNVQKPTELVPHTHNPPQSRKHTTVSTRGSTNTTVSNETTICTRGNSDIMTTPSWNADDQNVFHISGQENIEHLENDLTGIDNISYIGDEGMTPAPDKRSSASYKKEPSLQKATNGNAHVEDVRFTIDETRRKEFTAACRTVGLFMLTYIGCCGPYYIWMSMGIGCDEDCKSDTPEQRTVRSLVASALYMLPIVDPILYTQRFELFKYAALSILRKCFKCK